MGHVIHACLVFLESAPPPPHCQLTQAKTLPATQREEDQERQPLCLCQAETLAGMLEPAHTDKKENKIFLIYKEIQIGSGAKSSMRKGFLILYMKKCANCSTYMRIRGSRQSYMTLHPIPLNFRIYDEIFFIFFSAKTEKKAQSHFIYFFDGVGPRCIICL